MDRAYSLLDVKSFTEDDDFVYIEGIASTPTVDRQGDIVDPMGAKFVTPMSMLLYHDDRLPVGNLTFARPTKTGIPFKGQIPKVKEEGVVKERVNEAIHSLKYGLIRAVSIGFKILQGGYEVMKDGGWLIKSWEWLELSLVVIPANSEAVISAVKSADLVTLSALGRSPDGRDSLSPGATGQKAVRRPIQLIKPKPLKD